MSTGSTERTEDTGSTVDPREELAALRARLADVERRLDALEGRPTARGAAPVPPAAPVDAADVARLAGVYRVEGLSRTPRDGVPGRHAQHLVLVERRGLADLAKRAGEGTPSARGGAGRAPPARPVDARRRGRHGRRPAGRDHAALVGRRVAARRPPHSADGDSAPATGAIGLMTETMRVRGSLGDDVLTLRAAARAPLALR